VFLVDANHPVRTVDPGADDAKHIGLVPSKGTISRSRDCSGRRPKPPAAAQTIVRELERERSRIARELHAGAGQPLAAIGLNLELLCECSAALPQQAREALARLENLSARAIEQVRSLSHKLHPPDWQNLTVADALRGLIDSSGLTTVLEIEVHIQPPAVEPPHATKIVIYRCAQECISNVLQHSGATRVELRLFAYGDLLELRVEDNGHGFAGGGPHTGIGLVAIREHASALGGICEISSNPTGSKVMVRVPLSEH
jgi:two-component system, NarL family, sensor kinase